MEYPTSRKKYYLQLTTCPKLTLSPKFLTDLRHWIESVSSESVRDIFIHSAERHAYFCVDSKAKATKLIKLFTSRNISCRGRTPSAELYNTWIMSSGTNYQIRLSNLNTIINAEEFTAWVDSLNCDASNIVLHSPVVKQAASFCIVSFNTIDAAIAVKAMVSNAMFRDQYSFDICHWHVPRKANTKSKSESPKKAKAKKTKSKKSGPLFLRDSRVPPPPVRKAPKNPKIPASDDPLASMDEAFWSELEAEISTLEDVSKYQDLELSSSSCSSSSGSNTTVSSVTSVQHKVSQQQSIIEALQYEKLCMLRQLQFEKQRVAQMSKTCDDIYSAYMRAQYVHHALQWSCHDAWQWFCSLENGYFMHKYNVNEYVFVSLNIHGGILAQLNASDVYRMGVHDLNDQSRLLQYIGALIRQ